MNFFKFFLLLISLLLFKNITKASHIIGGEMTYETIASTHFKIKMILYRDCFGDFGAATPFDNPAYITILRGDGSIFTINGQSSFTESYDTIETLPYPQHDSCVNSIIAGCTDRATYEFNLNLPFDTLGYHIVYERCCRSFNINNLNNANHGITITTFISKEAQLVFNNSPTFDELPPLFVFNNDLTVNYSATDIDGDSLVYSFCTPYSGAAPTNPMPQVSSGLPFSYVNYQTGFTANYPINNTFSIHPQTGLTNGTINYLGFFAIGVCVEEYRNGIWLSSTKRDYQLPIAPFGYNVEADIHADSINQNGEYVLNACDTIVTITNESGHSFYINAYQWEFLIDGQTYSSNLQHPTFTFPTSGLYKGKLMVNPLSTCQDSLNILINIMDNTIPIDFNHQYDSTIIDSVYFQSLGANNLISWKWNFGDEEKAFIAQPPHLYADSGVYQVNLSVLDSFACGRISKEVEYYPIPILLSSPAIILFENIQLQPNPARDETVLIFDNKKELSEIDLEMYNTIGQLIFTKKIPLHSGENRIPINIQHLENGMYWLILKNKNQIQTLKLLKSNL